MALGNDEHERFCQIAHLRIWKGEKPVQAYQTAYREAIWRGDEPPGDDEIASNVRRLRNRPEVKARLAYLADFAAKMAGVDAGWAMLQLKVRIADFNLDDYLTPRAEGFQRFFDVSMTTREQMGKVSEMTIEEEIVDAGEDTMRKVRKIKLKPYDPAAIIGLMARLAGWESPKRIAAEHDVTDRLAQVMSEIDGRTRGLPSSR